MRPPARVSQVREEAVALRLAGKSIREIRDTLGPVGKRTLSAALRDTPPAEWTRQRRGSGSRSPGTKPDQFRSPVLKHHNPKTVRTNIGDDYHGCLKVDVRRSAALYRKIEGWAAGVMAD